MSSKSLFGSFKYCLKSLLILGLFPWKFDGDKQTLRAIDWKIHMTIVFANYVIWSLPYDIHYFPFVVKEFSGNMPNSEILLFLFIIRRVNSFVFYVTLPIAHHITRKLTAKILPLLWNQPKKIELVQYNLDNQQITVLDSSLHPFSIFSGFVILRCQFLSCHCTQWNRSGGVSNCVQCH